ncbi:MAG: AAA family ATPase, partial [Gemmatimonadota bacterium]
MSDAPFTLDPSQEAAAELIATAPVGCVTGGPGTGKTTSLRTALDRLGAPVPVDLSADDPFDAAAQEGDLSAYRANRLPDPQIALCAPTGKAARRMSEATGRSASTIHRLLGYNGHSFRRDQDDPLDSRLVVVDEASMIDTMLMQALLRALRPETRLIMVGDADQLPSVGPGAIFSDLLDSGAVPSRRLTTLHRAAQESWICQNGPRFIAGDSIDLAKERDDFQFVEVETAASAAEAVVDGLAQWDAEHADEHGELQVLIPMRKHALGTTAVNAAIHGVLSTR